MGRFLYYLPGRTGVPSREDLAAAALGHAVERGAEIAAVEVSRGPDDGAGVIVGCGLPAGQSVGYWPDRQSWINVGGHWIGRELETSPGPAELVRKRMLPGHAVELMDGREWIIPVARAICEVGEGLVWRPNLPMVSRLGVGGVWEAGEIAAAYEPLWKAACDWWDAIVAGQEDASNHRISFGGLHDAAVTALAANYLIGREEASILGLLDEDRAAEVMMAVVDWPSFKVHQERQGKKALAPRP
jgi:hypothetical protein